MSSAELYYAGCEDYNYQPHFLEACSLCSKPLGHNTDIFMYRGDTPFCSQDCREEQIEIDETKERKLKLSSTKRSTSLRKSTEPATKNSDHPNKDLLAGTGTGTGTVSVA